MKLDDERSALSARLRRAGEIGLDGIARRARHRLRRGRRAAARAAWRHRYATEADAERLLAAELPGGDAAVAAVLDGGASAFYLDAADAALARSFAERHPAALAGIVAEADATLSGDWSWIVPGARADWHQALPGPGRWPLLPAGATGIDAERPQGDVRLVWEVGRCPHLVRLAQAAWCTREPRYALGVVELGLDFAAANPPGVGIAWEHAQEAALRGVALLWAYRLSRDLGAFDASARRVWLYLLLAHGDYVASHLSDQPVTHNHLVSEAAGLAVLGMALPSLPQAAHWRRVGLRLVWRELAKQVDDEGVHGEHAWHYHAFVLDSFLAVLLLAGRTGAAVPGAARRRIERMAEATSLLLREDGSLPPIGDTDAGRAFRLGADPLDRRDVLAAAAAAFARRDWGAIAGDAPGAFWLTGGRAVPGAGDATPAGRAHRFEAAGVGVARTGFDRAAEIVVFRAGATRFRRDVLRAHMHADALSVLWRVAGEDVLVDPGTYLYSESRGFRAALRSSRAHGCVVVDGRDQADVASRRFGIAGERPAAWLVFAGDARELRTGAVHPAEGPVRVRRRLAWRAGGPLVLCDDVVGAGGHRVEAWLALPPTRGAVDAEGATLALGSGRALRVQAFGDVDCVELLRPTPERGAGPGWLAPRYGVLVAGTALHLDAGAGPLPRRLVTVIQTAAASQAAPPPARCTTDASRAIVAAGGYEFRFEGEAEIAIRRLAQ
jgi:hypothetical protein